MIWLTWRQFRMQSIVAAAVLAVSAVVLAVTGAHIASLYNASGIAHCSAHGDCGAVTNNFLNLVNGPLKDHLPLLFGTALVALPALIGMFWGAPLMPRELEAGTHRLAWNQSVTRSHWLTVKLGLAGLASMAFAGLFSLMVTWSASPIDTANSDLLTPSLFYQRGITPIGYAAFAFTLGVAAGVILRRTIAAMAVTAAVFTAAQFAMRWLRPHLIAPLHATSAVTSSSIMGAEINGSPGGPTMTVFTNAAAPQGAWVLSSQTVDHAGLVFTGPPTPACLSQTASPQACTNSLVALHLRDLVSYEPASRYWTFQWYELAIYLALAVALSGLSLWWVRRRIS